MAAEISGFTTRLIVEYVRHQGGDRAVQRLLDGLQLDGPVARLGDVHAWFSWEDKLTLLERGAEVTGDPDFAFHVGQHAAAVDGNWLLKAMLRSLGTPSAIFARLDYVNRQFGHVAQVEVVSAAGGRATVRRWVPPGYATPPCDCQFAAGLLTAIPTLFELPPATVREGRCVRRGDPRCEYELRWREARPIAHLTAAAGLAAGAAFAAALGAFDAAPLVAGALVATSTAVGLLAGWKRDDARRLAFQREVMAEQRMALEAEHAAGAQLTAERGQAQLEVAQAMLRLSAAASQIKNLDELLRHVVTVLPPLVGCNRCTIWLIDEVDRVFRPAAVCTPDPSEQPTILALTIPAEGEHAMAQVVRHDHVLVVSETNRHLLPGYYWELGRLRSVAFAPLRCQGRIIGVMMVDRVGEVHRFGDEDLAVISAVASHAAVVIENAQLFADVALRADRDPLTGLTNHGYFHRRLEAEVARARRDRVPLSVLMIDLDGFKAVNDQHGHLAGDEVLRLVAAIIRDACRQDDVVSRYGGDEFAAVLLGADGMHARVIADRLQSALATRALTLRDGKTLALGLSIGVATLSEATPTGQTLLQVADHDLYRVKSGATRPLPLRRLSG